MNRLRLPIVTVWLLVALYLGATVSNNTPTTPTVLGAANGYYKDANGKSGSNLFSALHTISGGVTYSYSKLTYNDLWTAFATSDVYPAGSPNAGLIWDMYATCGYTTSQHTGSSSGECDGGFNREHSLPKSWFGGSKNYESTNQGCDLGHLVPTDIYVNGIRSNYAFGEVAVPNSKYNFAISKIGTSGTSLSVDRNTISGKSTTFSTATVFEPHDDYKGDFARMYMYMRARYDDLNMAQADGGTKHFTTTTNASADSRYGLTDYSVILLMKWHRQDPVSQKEIDRNNAMERLQGNRNPFIDYPILAEYLWGEKSSDTFYLTNATGSFSSDFIPGVSDGSNDGVGPIIPTYSIQWMVQGTRVDLQQVDEGQTPTPPTVSNCSASRVFVGWTANANVASKPTDLFTEAPQATKNATYYAVYADKAGTGVSTFAKATSLAVGDSVVIVCEKANMEMTGVPGTNKGELVDGLPTGSYLMEVVAGTGNTYAFKYGTLYLNCTGGSALSTSALVAENSSWTVTFSDGNAKITNVGYTNRSVWWNNGSPRFGTYTATSAGSNYYNVQLYKKTTGTGVTYSNYSLQCTTDCTATITILSDDEDMGTVEFVEN